VIVVLDSGIWISAFQFGGAPQAAVDSVFSDHTIAICDQIIAEVRATLVRAIQGDPGQEAVKKSTRSADPRTIFGASFCLD
jgi:hypothetical protein